MREIEHLTYVYPPEDVDNCAELSPRRRLPSWLDSDAGRFHVIGRADHGIHLFEHVNRSGRFRPEMWQTGRLCAGIVPVSEHGCVLTIQVRKRGVVFAYRELRLSLVDSFEAGHDICPEFHSSHRLSLSVLVDDSRIATMRVAEMGQLATALRGELYRQLDAVHRFDWSDLQAGYSRLNHRPNIHLGPDDCDFWAEAAPLKQQQSR